MNTGEKQGDMVDKLDTLKKGMVDNNPLSPAAMGRRLGLSHDTIMREIERGRIVAYRTPGGYWRIDREECRRYTEERLKAFGCKA